MILLHFKYFNRGGKDMKRKTYSILFAIIVSIQPIMIISSEGVFSRFDSFLARIYTSFQKTFVGGAITDFLSQSAIPSVVGIIFAKALSREQKSAAERLLTHSIQPITVTDTKLKDCIGVPPEVEILVDQIKEREAYKTVKAPFTKGVLLTGNPGTGKSFLARAIAGETECPFFNVSAPELRQPFVGTGPLMIRNLFKNAKLAALNSPSKVSIIFIDELDAVGGRGATHLSDAPSGVLQTLLTEIDGFNKITAQDLNLPWYKTIRISELPQISIVMLGATNAPQNIDSALKRPGRFDKIIEVGNPDASNREKIAELYLKEYPRSPDIEAKRLAVVTDGMSPAEIKALFGETARDAASKRQSLIQIKNFCKVLFDTNYGNKAVNYERKVLEVLITMYPCDETVTVDSVSENLAYANVQDIADIFENAYLIIKAGNGIKSEQRFISLENLKILGKNFIKGIKIPEFIEPQQINEGDIAVEPESAEEFEIPKSMEAQGAADITITE